MRTSVPTERAERLGWLTGLVDAYRDQWLDLVRLAYLLTGDRSVAEELVQDAFLAARSRWYQVERPRTYLRTAVVNATRDWGRHQQIVRKHRRSVEQALRPAVGTHEPDELWDALARLDDRRRRAVVLRFYLDLPDPEIAELLGCRPGTVRTLIHRALRDLRREVTP